MTQVRETKGDPFPINLVPAALTARAPDVQRRNHDWAVDISAGPGSTVNVVVSAQGAPLFRGRLDNSQVEDDPVEPGVDGAGKNFLGDLATFIADVRTRGRRP